MLVSEHNTNVWRLRDWLVHLYNPWGNILYIYAKILAMLDGLRYTCRHVF
jgi:hypothetical protein